ncbi:hypothetical protein P3T76_006239 [Phytophthora citrophthora]|uniref:Uncharacterized protein n=1 Tax=Phytophthora citrophthora TaxID=4793 RepID=A0AAD9LMS9_9STRA|nr:hypothetical protein P3T76_006239 [Phytophthora citrophthora]
MQPPALPSTGEKRIKKRRTDKKKSTAEAIEKDPESVQDGTPLSETRSPGPYRGKCLYQSRKCENERAIKRNGKPHNLCEEHRFKQNQHQRKFDAKKFSRKRRRSGSDEDVKVDLQPGEEPRAKHQRTNEGATQIPTMRSYYTTGHTPVPRLPSLQSPRGPILPSSPVVFAPSALEAYPRSHVVYSDVRTGQRPNLQSSQVLPGYSQSELLAASILAQPQSLAPAVSTSVYRNEGIMSRERRPQSLTTPRMLPSLLVPPSAALSPSPYRGSGIVPSLGHSLAPVVTPAASVSASPARSTGHVLPPLVPFTLHRTPMSTTNSSKALN